MCSTDCKYMLVEEVCEQRRLLTIAIEKAEEMLKSCSNKNKNKKKKCEK